MCNIFWYLVFQELDILNASLSYRFRYASIDEEDYFFSLLYLSFSSYLFAKALTLKVSSLNL